VAKAKKTTISGKSKKAKALPVCMAMVLCDQVILGTDKVFSAIRIVDTVTVPRDESERFEGAVEFSTTRLLVILKRGDATGEFAVGLISTDPSGKRVPVGAAAISRFGEPDDPDDPVGGASINSPARIVWGGEGVYWLELQINGVVVAKTPLRIKIADEKKGRASRG
jgi:hypothetical protein